MENVIIIKRITQQLTYFLTKFKILILHIPFTKSDIVVSFGHIDGELGIVKIILK
mgnify:CR=1 FL=1